MKPVSEYNKGLIALVILSLSSVLMGVIVRELNPHFSLFQQLYLRLGFASFIGLFLFKKDFNWKIISKIKFNDWRLLILRTISGFVIASPLWIYGFNNAKLPNAVLIDAIPMSSVLGFFVLKEHISLEKISLLSLTFIGAALISVKDLTGLGTIGRGELFIFISIIFFAFRNISRKLHTDSIADATITQIMHVVAFFALLLISLYTDKSNPLSKMNFELSMLIISGGLLNLGILFFTNYGFARVDAVNAGNITLLAVVFGVIFGALLYKEVPTLQEASGGILIIISSVLLNNAIRRKKYLIAANKIKDI